MWLYEDSWSVSESTAHRDAILGQQFLYLADRMLIIVEDTGCQDRIGLAHLKSLQEIFWRTRTT